MEKAIHICDVKDLKYFDKKYKRIYFGNEFCERLIPSVSEIKRVMEFCNKNGLKFTFVTPYVTNYGIGKLKEIFDFLSKQKIMKSNSIEIVFNDYGVFYMLRNIGFKLVLGRLLTKQKRGPRILNLKNILSKNLYEHFKECSASSSFMQRFLLENHIKRIELDNLLQGIKLNLNKDIKASLYYPYLYTTTTRSCLVASMDKRWPNIYPCSRQCRNNVFELVSKNIPKKILIKGNTQFVFNNKLPIDLEKKGVDRLVCQPKIPI